MINQLSVWLIVAVFFLLVEIGAPGLFLFLSFSVGAFITALATGWVNDIGHQMALFLGASVVAFIILSWWLQRRSAQPVVHTNVDALKGKMGIVIKVIDGSVGQVNVQGEVWSARAVHNKTVAVGTKVRVVDVRGSHVVVTD